MNVNVTKCASSCKTRNLSNVMTSLIFPVELSKVLEYKQAPSILFSVWWLEYEIRLYWTGLPWLTFERLDFSHTQYGAHIVNLLYLGKRANPHMCFISFSLTWPHFVGVMLNTVCGLLGRTQTPEEVTRCKHI